MESLSITLKIDGKDKRFVTPSFIPGKLFRQASEISDEFEKGNVDKVNFDKYFQFVCDVFENKFDIEQFENGMDARKILNTVYATTHYVIGNVEIAIQMLSDAESKNDQSESKN
jgi:hypothetical protein